MLDVTVKTLDGTNRSFSVPDDITVKDFKEKIAGSINITADTQRLIFLGRVLQDEKNLNEYDVNGKTLHVVQRPPPASRAPPSTPQGRPTTQPSNGQREGRTLLGSFTLPGDAVDPTQIQNIVSEVLSGMGQVGRNATFSARSGGDGSSVDIHINLGNVGPHIQSESQNRIRIAQRMLRIARQALDRLENPPANESAENDPMDTTPSEDATPDQERSRSPAETPEDIPPETPGESPTTSTTTRNEGVTAMPQAEGGQSPSETTPTTSNSQTTGPQTGPRVEPNPRLPVLADTLQEVFELNQRLQPHLDRYQQFLRDDPALEANSVEARSMGQLSFRVSEVMHYISHAYHSLSDIMVDMNQAPPRTLRASPVAMPAAIIQQTIPVQAQINVAHVSPRASPQTQRRATATTTQPSSTSTTTTSRTGAGGTPTTSGTTAFTGLPYPQPQMRWPGGFPPRLLPPVGQLNMDGGPRLAGAAAFTSSGQPLMFMEVGPQGIAINSVSAQVVSAPGGTPNTNSTATTTSSGGTAPSTAAPGGPVGPVPGGQPGAQFQGVPGIPGLPPNILQNIVQMAQQSATGAMGGQQVFMFTQPMSMPGTHSPAATAQAGTTSNTSVTSSTATTSQTGQPTTSQPGQSSSTQMPPPPLPPMAGLGQQRFPGLMLPGGRRAGNGLDPYLPCPSRFFMRRRLQAATQGESAQGGVPVSSVATGTAPGQDQDLGGMISNLVSSAIAGASGMMPQASGANTTTTFSNPPAGPGGQVPPSIPVNPFMGLFNQGAFGAASPPARGPAGPATSVAGSQSTGGSGANLSGPDPPSILELRNLLQGSSATTSQSTATTQSQISASSTTTSQSGARTTSSSQSGSRTSGSQPMGDEMFTQMVRGIGTYVSQAAAGQQSSDSISDFISALGQETAPTEGLLSDIFACVSQHLTIVDLMAVLCEQTTSLQRLVCPLQEFVRTRVLQDEEATPENLDSAVDRLVEEMLPQIEEICTDAAVKENIDFPASVQELMRHHLRVNAQLILDARENQPNFDRNLFNNIRLLLHEFLVLSRCCLQNGQQAVQEIVAANIRRISADVNPMIQQWMSSMTIQQLQTTMQAIRVSEDQVERYIVQRAEPAARANQGSPQSMSSDASFMSAESGDKGPPGTEVGAVGGSAREAASCEDLESPNSSLGMDVDSTVPSPSRDRGDRRPVIDPEILQRIPAPPTRDWDPPVVIETEDWHAQVPSDWVPVITNDVRTQRQQRPQAPLSDAYLNGMPAKRRKLMNKSSSDETAELSNVAVLIPQAIETAARNAGAEPITSTEDMRKDASTSATLRSAFQQEMDDAIRRRIESDPDYIPEKYPNVEKYYKKKE